MQIGVLFLYSRFPKDCKPNQMKRLLLPIFLLFSGLMFSAPEKPSGCRPYHCSDYEWDHHMKRFDPTTIQWPLHYTGELMIDRIDGGKVDIDVIYKGHYNKNERLSLSQFRRRPDCPSPSYLSDGLSMYESFVCSADPQTEPIWEVTGCSLVGVSMYEQTLNISGEGCAKKLRHWTVVDWCGFIPNGDVHAENTNDTYVLIHDLVNDQNYYGYGDDKKDVQIDGWYTFTQVIKIVDDTPPHLASCEDQSIKITSGCDKEISLFNTVSDEGQCSGPKMDITLEVYNEDGALVTKKWFYSENNKEFSQNIGKLSPGQYQVYWLIKDGCGNFDHCSQRLEIIDNTAPFLTCIQNLSTSISDDLGMTIWAKDFVLKAENSCSTKEAKIAFSPDGLVTSQHFNCTDGTGFHNLTIYAIDEYGNYSTCPVELFITDQQVCNTAASTLGGIVFNSTGTPLESVIVDVMQVSNSVASEISNDLGQYFIKDIPLLKSKYILEPHFDDPMDQGLDATDLILLSEHILGSKKFTDVLEFAAADINNDAAIDWNDYWALAHLIYKVPQAIDNFKSWKFIDKRLFDSGINRASKLTIPIELKLNRARYDIIALKAGDIDFSWSPEKQGESRNRGMKVNLSQNVLTWESHIEGLILFLNDISREEILALNPWLSDQLLIEKENQLFVQISSDRDQNANKLHFPAGTSLDVEQSLVWVNQSGISTYKIDLQHDASSLLANPKVFITPNPFNDILNITADDGPLTDDVLIYTSTGQLLKRLSLSGDNQFTRIDLSGINYYGLLIVKYTSGGSVFSQKVIRLQ